VGEALITGGIVSYVVAQRPDLVMVPRCPGNAVTGVGRLVTTGLIAALVVAAFIAPFATEGADGLEAVAEEAQFDSLEQPTRALVFDDYVVPLPGLDLTRGFWQKVSVALAGIIGTASVMGLAWMFGRTLQPQVVAAEVHHGG
jgi:hypothetical protein